MVGSFVAGGSGAPELAGAARVLLDAVRKMRLEPARAREIVEDLAHWMPVDTTIGLVQQAGIGRIPRNCPTGTPSSLQPPSVPAPDTCFRRTSSPTAVTRT